MADKIMNFHAQCFIFIFFIIIYFGQTLEAYGILWLELTFSYQLTKAAHTHTHTQCKAISPRCLEDIELVSG